MAESFAAQRIAADCGDRYASISEFAALLGASIKTARRALSTGKLPPPDLRLSKRMVRWRLSTIQSWMNKATRVTKCQGAVA